MKVDCEPNKPTNRAPSHVLPSWLVPPPLSEWTLYTGAAPPPLPGCTLYTRCGNKHLINRRTSYFCGYVAHCDDPGCCNVVTCVWTSVLRHRTTNASFVFVTCRQTDRRTNNYYTKVIRENFDYNEHQSIILGWSFQQQTIFIVMMRELVEFIQDYYNDGQQMIIGVKYFLLLVLLK